MKEYETGAVGTDQQVVEVALGGGQFHARHRNVDDLFDRDQQLLAAAVQVDAEDTRSFGRPDATVGVVQSWIAVGGPHVADAAKVGRHRPASVRADRIDRMGDGSPLVRLDVQDATHKAVLLAIVPEDFGFRAGPPLEHAALLPTPGATLSQFDPLVAVLKVDHPDLDHIAGCR